MSDPTPMSPFRRYEEGKQDQTFSPLYHRIYELEERIRMAEDDLARIRRRLGLTRNISAPLK